MEKHVANLKKKNIEVKHYTDYRKLVDDKDIDAVTIATPNHTHTLIAMTALAAGKHVYVEKPVCHNITEGAALLKAAENVVGKRGSDSPARHAAPLRPRLGRRRSTSCKSGAIGKLILSRGINYKMRPSIGKVAAPRGQGRRVHGRHVPDAEGKPTTGTSTTSSGAAPAPCFR